MFVMKKQPVYFIIILLSLFLPTDALAKKPVYVYIAGGGGVEYEQIWAHWEQIRELLVNGPNGEMVELKLYVPDQDVSVYMPGIEQTWSYKWYSQAEMNNIQNFLLLNQGEDLHVVGASMGAGILRDNIFPTIEGLGFTLDLGSLMMVEAMAPMLGMNNYWISDAIDFDLYVSYETDYIGPFGETFKLLSGAGPLVPEDWQNRNCYFFPSYLGHLYMKYPWDFTKAIVAHGGGVGNGEDFVLKLLEMYLEALSATNPQQAVQEMLDDLNGWKQIDPTIPFPDTGSDPDPGDDDPVTGGGSGPSGGGSGVESFPHWLLFEEYRRVKPKLFEKSKGSSPNNDYKEKYVGIQPKTTKIPETTEREEE